VPANFLSVYVQKQVIFASTRYTDGYKSAFTLLVNGIPNLSVHLTDPVNIGEDPLPPLLPGLAVDLADCHHQHHHPHQHLHV
jgi:hypothetical protein